MLGALFRSVLAWYKELTTRFVATVATLVPHTDSSNVGCAQASPNARAWVKHLGVSPLSFRRWSVNFVRRLLAKYRPGARRGRGQPPKLMGRDVLALCLQVTQVIV